MGMAFRGNIWGFNNEPDAKLVDIVKPVDTAEPSSTASQTPYEKEMLRMVTTLLDYHHTWMSKLDSIEH